MSEITLISGEIEKTKAFICSRCQEEHSLDRQNEYNENFLCNACYKKYIAACEHCGKTYEIEDLTLFDDTMLCAECLNEGTSICYECGGRIWNEDNCGDSDRALCSHCYDYHYTHCRDCGRLIHESYAEYLDGDDYNDSPFCNDCIEKQKQKNIQSYYHKPEPIFYRNSHTDIVFGVELEIDGGGEDDKNAGKLLEIANGSDERLYCKHDGSLNNGFELVSHPMSLDYHKDKMPWKRLLAEALFMGYKSHDSGTCGLHIHVGRNELGEDYEAQEEVIARILYFIEKHWDNMLLFSRRTEIQINKWAARYGCKENPKETLKAAKGTYARYVSLNLQNCETIEFRMFRGTLKYTTFIAALQLVDAICGAAIVMSDKEFQAMTWLDFLTLINQDEKPELVTYLKERNLYIEPVLETSLNTERGNA